MPECLVVFRCLYHVSCVSDCGIVLVFHSSCRLRHATLCFLPLGLTHAAHPAVLPISSPKYLRILVLVFQPIIGPVSLLWRPNFRLTVLTLRSPRCAFNALDETTVPDFLIILCSNRLCCVYIQCCSDDVLVALCGSSKPNAWNESGIELAVFQSPRLGPSHRQLIRMAEAGLCSLCDVVS